MTGGIGDLLAALTILGLIRKREAREEARTSKQEEVFVPFNLPPLPQQGQLILHPAAEAKARVAVAPSA